MHKIEFMTQFKYIFKGEYIAIQKKKSMKD